MPQRDTHFVGFAKLLYEELARNVVTSSCGVSNIEAFKQEQYAIIAKRAYDFAEHVLLCPSTATYEAFLDGQMHVDECVEDLTHWPEDT